MGTNTNSTQTITQDTAIEVRYIYYIYIWIRSEAGNKQGDKHFLRTLT